MARGSSVPALLIVAAAALVVMGAGVRQGSTAPVQASSECMDAMSKASVDGAYVVEAGPAADGGLQTVALGQRIAVRINGLADLKAKCGPIILFLNGYPIKSVKPYPPAPPPQTATATVQQPPPNPPPPGGGDLWFTLTVTDGSTATDGSKINDGSRDYWTPILGRPPWPGSFTTLSVSVGVEDQYPLRAGPGKSLPEFKFNPLHTGWFAVWSALFLALLGLFVFCSFRSNIIREGNPAGDYVAGAKGTYSLSKSQGAWWFFIILAAYLFIGIVTGDYLNSINSTALILLGIGAGTVIGSAAIDASKSTPESVLAERNKIIEIKAKMDQLDAKMENRPTAPPLPDAEWNQMKEDMAAQHKQARSSYRKLIGQSEDFFTNVLSDANGVSFHRFQMMAFTLILGFVFIRGVYDNLAMPEFNTTLMGLLELSAGTYLGLKIPEATTPKT